MVRARWISDVDWTRWSPVDPATLIFVVRDGQILLIRKKRGLGAGKINGPGGRLEPDEAPAAGAARELREELGVGVADSVKLGEHRFQFVDGYSIHVHVYRATGLRGTPIETDEAVPMWVDIRAIPYDEMWEDDRLWLPLLLDVKVLPEGASRRLQPVVNKFFFGLRANAIETQRLTLWWGERMLTTRRPLEEKLTSFGTATSRRATRRSGTRG